MKFIEYRCRVWNHLLFKARWKGEVEIVNQKTRYVNYLWPSRKGQDIGLKGIQFQQECYDINCPECKRLLCKAIWTTLEIEIKCRYCWTVSEHDLFDYVSEKLWQIPTQVGKALFWDEFEELREKRLKRMQVWYQEKVKEEKPKENILDTLKK